LVMSADQDVGRNVHRHANGAYPDVLLSR
jgi:hypothetical protein